MVCIRTGLVVFIAIVFASVGPSWTESVGAQEPPVGAGDFTISPPLTLDVVPRFTRDAAMSGNGQIVVGLTVTSSGGEQLVRHDRSSGARQVLASFDNQVIGQIDVSEDGTVVVFATPAGLSTWSEASGPVVRLATTGIVPDFQQPMLSTDGSVLVFNTNRPFLFDGAAVRPPGLQYATYRLDLTNNQLLMVDWPSSPGNLRNQSISAHADRIAVGTQSNSVSSALFVYDIDTGQALPVAQGEWVGRSQLTGDGSVLFYRGPAGMTGGAPNGLALYRLDLDSENLTSQIDGLDAYGSVLVSVDGRYAALDIASTAPSGYTRRRTAIVDLLLQRVIPVPLTYRLPTGGREVQFSPAEWATNGGHLRVIVGLCESICSQPSRALIVTTGLPRTAELIWSESQTPLIDEVRRIYRASFGRESDTDGLGYWVHLRATGTNRAAIASAFLASGESTALYGSATTNNEFVARLYRNVLDREPDTGGRDFWLAQLAAGTGRTDLLIEFADSAENVSRTGTSRPQRSSEGELLRLYQAVFGRFADPDGFRYWMAVRDNGTTIRDVAGGFVASAEFVQRYGNNPSPADLVDAMYRNVLGRSADSEGRNFWLGEMGRGMTTLNLLLAFTNSTENILATSTQP